MLIPGYVVGGRKWLRVFLASIVVAPRHVERCRMQMDSYLSQMQVQERDTAGEQAVSRFGIGIGTRREVEADVGQ